MNNPVNPLISGKDVRDFYRGLGMTHAEFRERLGLSWNAFVALMAADYVTPELRAILRGWTK